MPIRQLPQTVINRIAAGEVIERPASAVKELVENAIDAGSRHIEIVTADGGLSLIRVSDDGNGMDAADLELCIERHATSKLTADSDLMSIATLGFRGEALPSIAAVAKLSIASRARGSGEAWQIQVEGGRTRGRKPVAINGGTRVEVRDLFYATPARLKFMKSGRAENMAIADTVKRLALARPGIGFSLTTGERASLLLEPALPGDESGQRLRLSRVMGKDFAVDAEPFETVRDGLRLWGYAGLPTLNRNDTAGQFIFVNGRPVKDRLLASAVRAAYGDLVPRGRYPMLAIFIETPERQVDVNVHPAKSEVRFQDGGLIRAALIATLRRLLAERAGKTSHAVQAATLDAFRAPALPGSRLDADGGVTLRSTDSASSQPGTHADHLPPGFGEAGTNKPTPLAANAFPELQRPLGAARAQFHENYILAETDDAVIIVDQHAAHERLVYERLKAALAAGRIETQVLLIPEVVELDAGDAENLGCHAESLASLGLVLESFGEGAIVVRELPAMLAKENIASLIRDLAADLGETMRAESLTGRLHAVAAKLACYGSVRSGRRLSVAEMDALLRQMEATPHSGQCNHGRPTFVKLHRNDIERLFGRR